ncbi:hypothetical protein FEM48_Zijuj01G0270000 [Ziziphus jujuba var. spinosa]|uniref:DUF4220 domain-containing protein n=1 Tax=Ziziphus jujuba var. spinosa TaxID=714518 RepID=A0A978W554_ZIZJJ|nr:hypothetical protein FEM48_Zijuj01G0270000 [Ziziphus jujuba var. spinosa]
MQIVPEKLRKLWNEWELRGMVLTSLALQIILIVTGDRRKYSSSNKIRIVLWLAYLSADSVATVSLGILSSNQEDNSDNGRDSSNSNNVLTALWAPFLLLHLGGPDTITAYSLEDNELWLRHLLGLVVQFGVAFYVFLSTWESSVINFLAIPVFVAGIIKFGERTWVLRSASSEHFRESILPEPDPGPNYARYMEEYCTKKAEGFKVESRMTPTVIEVPMAGNSSLHYAGQAVADTISDTEILHKAHSFFKTFKKLCADLILSFHDILSSQSFYQKRSSDNAFKVVELELGFMYDVFYTKANLVYSLLGVTLRCISFFSTLLAFLVFLIFPKKKSYMKVDIFISYVLLVGAITLEFYAVIIKLSSDWTMIWLSKHKNMAFLYNFISTLAWTKRNKGWSNTIAQYNLVRFCLKDRPPKCILIQKVLFVDQLLERYRYKDSECVSAELKKLIFEQLKEKSRRATNFRACKQLCAARGDSVLDKANCLDKLGWTTEEEFDHSLLLWHIATDLCYYHDLSRNMESIRSSNCKASQLLSNYMLYILVMCPFMLPNGIGQIRLRDTCAEAVEFFKERKSITDAKDACSMLMKVNTEVHPSKVKGDRSKSVLFEACVLAKNLQSLEAETNWDNGKKWELMSHVWVEMLCYAANHCRWSNHAQQLRRGGELLTHVWLLMAHLGITEQFQISKGHARAKLILK